MNLYRETKDRKEVKILQGNEHEGNSIYFMVISSKSVSQVPLVQTMKRYGHCPIINISLQVTPVTTYKYLIYGHLFPQNQHQL